MKNEEERLMKLSFQVKTKEQRKKEIDDRNLYNELMKKTQIENKIKERELQAKENQDKKVQQFRQWKVAKHEQRNRFFERA